MLSLWYRWRDGGFDCATSVSADVGEYLAHDDGVGERAAVSTDEDKQSLRSLLDRYLGGTDSALAGRLLREEHG